MGDANGMATDQVCYALVAYDRFLKGKASLYDMSDVTFEDDTNISNGENTQEKENNADKENVDSDIGENPNNQTSTTVKPQDPPTDKTDGSVIPQTGEKNNLIFYVAIMTASAIGTILFLQKLKTGEN